MTITQGLPRIMMKQAIEDYIVGRLTQEEIDQLWIQILQVPEYISINMAMGQEIYN